MYTGKLRNVRNLALVEACQFVYGISLLACGEVENGRFSQLASATRLTFYPPTFRKWQLIATIALARETPICSKRPSVMYTT